jgi:retron-type reverse transcriptase
LNRVLVQTDIWLSDAAQNRGAVYSRYADDLTFSGDNGVPELLAIARKMLANIGLKLDKKKTQIFRQGRRQIVTGLVVNERPSVPRSVRRKVRAAVHAVEQGRNPTWHGGEESLSALLGRTAFVRSVNEEEGSRLLNRLRAKLNQANSSDDD